MFSAGKKLVAAAVMPLASAGWAFPAAAPAVAGTPSFADASADATIATPDSAASLPAPAPDRAGPVIADPAPQIGALISDTVVDSGSAGPSAVAPLAAAPTAELDPELECLVKVVHHEAGNQSRRGQLAVAQLIMNRIQSGRFAATICGVANQPGQFFHTSSYNPPRGSAGWASAVEVARAARDGTAEAVAPGALFFHAAYAASGNFFRSRQRIASLGGNVFYR